MPETPADEELTAVSKAVDPSPSTEVSEPPRTVRRRVPRRVQTRPMTVREAPVAHVETEGSAVESTHQAAVEQVVEEPVAVDTVSEAEAAVAADTAPEAVVEASEAEPAEAMSLESAPSETAPTVDTAARPAPRTGRIEVPVPSVVRARERAAVAVGNPVVLRAESLTKSYGQLLAAADVSFDVHAGSLTGVVGPNGAGKTTVLSMISGLNRPTSGRVVVRDIDVWGDGPAAKRVIGSLPDRLRLFDRLTGGQLLFYAGVLQGLDRATVATRAAELAEAFGLESALDRPVSDYSAGMQKKIGLACSMIHAPDVLVLDEPYETIDPVSASNVTEILEKYVAGGGSVIMSSHSLDLIQRICDHAVIIVDGSVVAKGTVDEVRDGVSLEERFRHLTSVEDKEEGLEWLQGSSDFD